VLFLEQVHITRGRTRLQSDRGRYERATGMVYVEGQVRLRDSTTTVTCDNAQFSENQDRLDLRGNVVVVDHEATLKAPYGWFDRKRGLAQLQGGVRGSERKQRLVAGEAYYDRDSMLVKARGDVIGYDDENRTQLEAQAVDFDRRAKVAVATGQPVLRSKDDDGRADAHARAAPARRLGHAHRRGVRLGLGRARHVARDVPLRPLRRSLGARHPAR
jgi:lipopolysaccharide assembly outer membrane protein LptD (OstA)